MTVFKACQQLQEPNEEEDGFVEDPTYGNGGNSVPTSTASRSKGGWYSITDELLPGAEVLPQTITEYLAQHIKGRRSPEKLMKLRKHLVVTGWKIDRKEDNNSDMVRYRYTSPDGICYYSLNMVCHRVLKEQVCMSEVPQKQVPVLRSHQEKQSIGSNCNSVASFSKIVPLLRLVEEDRVFRKKRTPSHRRKQVPDHSIDMIEERCIENNFSSFVSLNKMSVPPLLGVVAEERHMGNNWYSSDREKQALEHFSNEIGGEMGVENTLSSYVASEMPKENTHAQCGITRHALEYSSDLVEEEQYIESNSSPISSVSETLIPVSGIFEEGQSIGNNRPLLQGIESNWPAATNVTEMQVDLPGVGEKEQCIGNNHSSSGKNIRALKHSRSLVEKEQGVERDSDMCNKKRRLEHSDDIFYKQEYCPPAVIYYSKLESRVGNFKRDDLNVDMKQLMLKVKMHLSAEGWRFWHILKRERREMRYCSPTGKTFCSLITACRAWVKNAVEAGSRLEGLAGKTSQVLSTEFEESSFDLTPSKEILCHQTNACLVERGNPNELPGASSCNRKKRCSVDQFTDSRKLKKPKASRIFFKQGNIVDVIDSKHVLKLSKRSSQHNTLLSKLIDNGVVLPGQEVSYMHKKNHHAMAKGQITNEGIKCNCCGKVYGLSKFEVHAGSSNHCPAANIFLQDGRSLLDCQLQLATDKSDNICSVCYDGGELVLCWNCPSGFHPSCVGLEDIPEGEWLCPSCRCGICGQGDFIGDSEQYTEKTVICCDQCKREYHVGCLREREFTQLKRCSKGNWFCNKKCSEIFVCLQELVGKLNPTGLEGLTWTILREAENIHNVDTATVNSLAEHHKKLLVARRVLHECFERMFDPRTKREIISDVLFNKDSDLNRTDYRGFYTILLERGNEVLSVAIIRIFNEKVAEMPLIGTRRKYRRQGMCHLLMNELEKMLSGLGVERLLLPSAPALLETWTTSFGFTKMEKSDRLQFLQHTYLEFLGTTLCQKLLVTSTTR